MSYTQDYKEFLDQRVGRDRTPGEFSILFSPFKRASDIATRLNITRGGKWSITSAYIGGYYGAMTQAVEETSLDTVNLWQDSAGGWWVQKKLGLFGWIADIDATIALARQGQTVDEDSTGMWDSQIKHGQA